MTKAARQHTLGVGQLGSAGYTLDDLRLFADGLELASFCFGKLAPKAEEVKQSIIEIEKESGRMDFLPDELIEGALRTVDVEEESGTFFPSAAELVDSALASLSERIEDGFAGLGVRFPT